ncbi:MAG TPA: class I SAM-dependent methyltransferase [Thermoanaerobaculia bacterium]|nr:class I SAM-dependent methyltransferase [Thermoanaerobaculia bacterium]
MPLTASPTRKAPARIRYPAVAAGQPPVRRAYDAAAATYDERVARSAWVRELLWRRLDELLPAGARVLDATAGTGCDAVHLAARGVAVTACDISPAMLDRLAAKDRTIRTRVADCGRLPAALPGERFDAVLSTFAGLNTVADLDGFAHGAAGLLAPGGVLFVQLLNRWPVAELARRWRRGGLTAAWQALAAAWRGERQVEIGGVRVPHRLLTPRRLYRRVFARDFALLRVRGQGVLRPVDDPTATPVTAATRPEAASAATPAGSGRLDRWEERLGAWPGSRALGTFFTLELRRRGAPAAPGAGGDGGADADADAERGGRR